MSSRTSCNTYHILTLNNSIVLFLFYFCGEIFLGWKKILFQILFSWHIFFLFRDTCILAGAKELDCEESWALKNWCFWTVVLEKTLESPLECKKIQPVHSEGDQPWDFFGRNDAEAETPGLWPPHAKSWLIGKDSDAGRDWGQEEKGTPEDEMAGWHHWLSGCDSEWILGVGDGQGGLACFDSWGRKKSDTTEWLNWTETLKIKTWIT